MNAVARFRWIYFLWGTSGLLYIGQTQQRVDHRLLNSTHPARKAPWSRIDAVMVDTKYADGYEAFLISKHRPPYNGPTSKRHKRAWRTGRFGIPFDEWDTSEDI